MHRNLSNVTTLSTTDETRLLEEDIGVLIGKLQLCCLQHIHTEISPDPHGVYFCNTYGLVNNNKFHNLFIHTKNKLTSLILRSTDGLSFVFIVNIYKLIYIVQKNKQNRKYSK